MASVELIRVTKAYDGLIALKDVSFECHDGELVALLGSAGAGKTSLLKIISGLEGVATGEVHIGGELVNELPAEKRDTAMVFETYSLYPHFSVYKNMAFPLHAPVRKSQLRSSEIEKRVRSVAEVLKIGELLDRFPSQLSGGQRQRVALGRALVRDPKVFLMDEPLAHLDAKLRHELRGELKRVQKDIGITTIYATPDYTEAMAMADHVVFLHEGTLHQYGTPADIFDRPASVLVAQMVGDPPMNLFDAEIVSEGGRFRFKSGDFTLEAPEHVIQMLKSLPKHETITVGVRPTDLIPSLEPGGGECIAGVVHVFEPLGPSTLLTVRVGARMVSVKVRGEFAVDFDEKVWLDAGVENIHLFDAQTGRRLHHDFEKGK